jgi:organic radical activating enzyme
MKQTSNIRLSITDDCNRLCPECPIGGWHAKKRPDKTAHYIDMDVLIEFLESEYQIINLIVSGGEPTLHPELSKLLDWASSNSEKILLETNGLHLDLLENYPKLRVLLPIYQDESLVFKLNQIRSSKNIVYIQTFKNHPDFERTHQFAIDNNLNEFISVWNDDFKNSDVYYAPHGNFGPFFTPDGRIKYCPADLIIIKAISPYYKSLLDLEEIVESPDYVAQPCRECPQGNKYNYMFSHFYES